MPEIMASDLSNLELELNKISFLGLPVGGMIANGLYIWWANDGQQISVKDSLISWTRSLLYARRSINTQTCQIPDHEHGVFGMITKVSERAHFRKMTEPLVSIFKDEKLVILQAYAQDTQYPKHLCIDANIRLPFDFAHWKNEFSKVRKTILKGLKKFKTDFDLTNGFVHYFYANIIVQSQKALSFESLLQKLQPKFIITEYDRIDQLMPLIATANKLGINTYTMMHGVINNKFGYVPLYADKALTWGSIQKNQLAAYGVENNALEVVGATQLERISLDKNQIKYKIGIGNKKKKIALFANNVFDPSKRSKIIHLFCTALGQNDASYIGLFRLHPSENIADYRVFKDQYPNVFFHKSEINAVEAIGISDVICVFNTALAMEALVNDKAVIVIDANGDNLGQAKDWVGQGFKHIKSSHDLIKLLVDFNSDTIMDDYIKVLAKYKDQYCFALGAEAAMNIKNIILKDIIK